MNAHEPAINQVGDDQTRFMIVSREPGHDVNDILQLQYVLPDTVFHVGHLCLVRRTRCPFRFNNFRELSGRLNSQPFQVFGGKLELECVQCEIDVVDEHSQRSDQVGQANDEQRGDQPRAFEMEQRR